MQLDIFSALMPSYKILDNKKIRLIELFAGIGAQHKSLKLLIGEDRVESYKICEWAYKSYCCYDALHIHKERKDYSNIDIETCIKRITGTSANYNEPMSEKQIRSKGEEWIRKCYESCERTNNLINIMNVKGGDLEITDKDKFEYILTYSFPCQ